MKPRYIEIKSCADCPKILNIVENREFCLLINNYVQDNMKDKSFHKDCTLTELEK